MYENILRRSVIRLEERHSLPPDR